jgi:hypothetical protein
MSKRAEQSSVLIDLVSAVDLCGQFEQNCHRFRRRKIIVHGGRETGRSRRIPVDNDAGVTDGGQSGFRKGSVESQQAGTGVLKVRIRPIEGTPVMRPHNKKPQPLGVDSLQDLADREEIAKRFGHLFVINPHEPVVHPGTDEWLTVRECGLSALGLSDLVFMMRKLEIRPATMEIETIAQQLRRHGRALQVPTGSTLTVIGGPSSLRRIVRLGGFPENKIERILLVIGHCHTLTRSQFVGRLSGQSTITWKAPNRKQHVPAPIAAAVAAFGPTTSPVRETIALERPNHSEHRWHELGRSRLVIRGFDPKGTGILME